MVRGMDWAESEGALDVYLRHQSRERQSEEEWEEVRQWSHQALCGSIWPQEARRNLAAFFLKATSYAMHADKLYSAWHVAMR